MCSNCATISLIILGGANQIIVKYRSESLSLLSLQAGILRVDESHPQYPILSSNYTSKQAGIAGEERVERVFQNHSFPFQHRILHDLSLHSATTFQIDSLFLTQFYAILFEVKNISGKLTFRENPRQLIRERDDGQVDAFDCPAAQVERNSELLDLWLQSKGINIPVIGVVVLAYPKQIVLVPPKSTPILFPNLIPSYIRKIPQNRPILNEKDLDWLCTSMINSHQIYIPNPLSQTYKIQNHDFQTGVICDRCRYVGMQRISKKGWHCSHCNHTSKNAHINAVRDWFLLFGGKMTNKDCREFLHINIDTSTRILRSMDLISEGISKGRTYAMDFSKFI
ncbi:MAG TPA: nuclease-related domain-containing protein [Bacillaceae bacterium]|nr:nuclease-related domain-containing protein [Paenibacillus bovis]HLU23051.1 nuclease-related domain-containing protein [Bacillaceae bacterium]